MIWVVASGRRSFHAHSDSNPRILTMADMLMDWDYSVDEPQDTPLPKGYIPQTNPSSAARQFEIIKHANFFRTLLVGDKLRQKIPEFIFALLVGGGYVHNEFVYYM